MNINTKKIILIILVLFICFGVVKFINKNPKIENQKILITSDKTEIAINEFKTGHEEVLIIAPGWFMCKDSKPFNNMSLDFSKYFDVITINFRGHCRSSGHFTFTSKEYDDLNTVINYARKTYKKIYVAGFSLGSATAVITQEKYKNADKIILVSPPDDFDTIENHVWKKEAYIPTLQKCELKTWLNIRPGQFWLEKTKPVDVIEKISPTPILIIAGTKDPTIYVKHSQNLFKKAKEPKNIIIFGDSIHAEDIYLKNPQRFISICSKWLKD